MPVEKNYIMTRISIDDESWDQFKEQFKPMNVADALGMLVKLSLDAEKKPFQEVVEDLMKDIFKGVKKSSPS